MRVTGLVGSAKPRGQSTSELLLTRLLDTMTARGAQCEIHHVATMARGERGLVKLADAVADSQLFVVAHPVYVDSLPYLVVRALEALAERAGDARWVGKRMAALVNCGFPEASHCDLSLSMHRLFARHMGWQWAGGLTLPEGQMLAGRSLEGFGGLLRHLVAGLEDAANALASGGEIPVEAVAKFRRSALPPGVYRFLGARGWTSMARQHGALAQIHARPFDLDEPVDGTD